MARIIDKEEKRCDIALASIDLFCEKGIQQTSIDEIAKSAGVAKGTIYLYFKNKDEIVFSIWEYLAQKHINAFNSIVKPSMNAREKILLFYNFEEFDESTVEAEKILNLYQHFISSMLIDTTGIYAEYSQSFFQRDFDFISACLQEGVDSGEFKEMDITLLTNTLVMIIKGTLIKSKACQFNFKRTKTFLNQHLKFVLENFARKEL
ncbi:MAG: TetR/AcrR family transcriptional regulator [Sulfurospirillaceae bacterium]|nr:TetR/AcrR family transcriptional regulator [Sulfurospirillaceae bacterium]